MLQHRLQRRAFGVELWAMTPSRSSADETYVVRVFGNGQMDRHFDDASSALDEFFKRVREAMQAD